MKSCDNKKILVLDICYKADSLSFFEFVKPICDVVSSLGLEFEARHYMEDIDFSRFSKVVICGTALQDHGHFERLERFEWIKDTEVSVLGICAGYQVIGKVFGSEIVTEKKRGLFDVETVASNKLFSGKFKGFELHGMNVDVKAPLKVIATRDGIPVAFKYADKEIYGLLFHPEVRNKEILERFLIDDINHISEKTKKEIEISRKEIALGKVHIHEQVKKELRIK